MSSLHLVVDAQVFAEDIVRDLSADDRERLLRIDGYTPDVGTDDVDVADALLESPLDFGPRDTWHAPYADLGLGGSALELLAQVRIWNHPAYCRISGCTEKVAARAEWFEVDGNVVHQKRKPGVLFDNSLYTLPLTIEVPRSPPAVAAPRTPPPTAAVGALRPATSQDLRGLAGHLAPRVAVLPGGAARLDASPILSPIFAMVGSIRIMMEATSRKSGNDHVYRGDVLDACLDALRLDGHRRTAERILLRDDPEHLHVDAWTERPDTPADEQVAPPRLRHGLGLFARTTRGIVHVPVSERRQHGPRILYSLGGPEPP